MPEPTMRVLVTGGDGLLAFALRSQVAASPDYIFVSRTEFDLTQIDQMRRVLDQIKPDTVVNTAAYNLVDRCEQERDLSWAVNATGPASLARLCAERGTQLVHYSSDYVFDGAKKSPYTEIDEPHPLNHYGDGKLTGERAVLEASPRHLVLRTSWVFGAHPVQKKTFVHTVLKAAQECRPLKATTDQASVPTYAPDLAEWTVKLLRTGAGGLFHAVNDEGLSRFDWANAIVEDAALIGILSHVPVVEPVLSSFFSTTMKRPDYTVMSNQKLSQHLGQPAGSWRPGLRKMLAQMK